MRIRLTTDGEAARPYLTRHLILVTIAMVQRATLFLLSTMLTQLCLHPRCTDLLAMSIIKTHIRDIRLSTPSITRSLITAKMTPTHVKNHVHGRHTCPPSTPSQDPQDLASKLPPRRRTSDTYR